MTDQTQPEAKTEIDPPAPIAAASAPAVDAVPPIAAEAAAEAVPAASPADDVSPSVTTGRSDEPAPAPAAAVPAKPLWRPDAAMKKLRATAGGLQPRLLKSKRYAKPAAAAAAALVFATGAGFGLGRSTGHSAPDTTEEHLVEAAASLRQGRDEFARLGGDLKSLRASVEALKGERDRARGDLAAKQTQLGERFDKIAGEMSGRLKAVTDGLDRVEKTQRDPARIAMLTERLDRIDKQLGVPPSPTAGVATPLPAPTPTPTPPPKPVAAVEAVTQTGSLADAKPAAKPADADPRHVALDGFVIRDVDDGFALIEARNGRLLEVSPGMSIPGGGRVEAIERRGRRWVVVTSKGFIAER